jgi:hypothetical protein
MPVRAGGRRSDAAVRLGRRRVLLAILLIVTGAVVLLQVFKVLAGVVGIAEYLIVIALVIVLFGLALLRKPRGKGD